MTEPSLCEDTTGLPCVETGDLDLPEGDATIVGVLDVGSVMDYTDPEGEQWQHVFDHPHQLVAIGDSNGNQALLIISDHLQYTDRGIVG